jgi:hypothetical protein
MRGKEKIGKKQRSLTLILSSLGRGNRVFSLPSGERVRVRGKEINPVKAK